MVSVHESLRLTFEKKTPNALKAGRVKYCVTFNPNKMSPGKNLRVAVPKLEDGVLLVPGSFVLAFKLVVSSDNNNFLVNNRPRLF